ncbi:hypothetical protein SAY87_012536 [Trapa incisa]|uniref:WAT1-related protein n=1 Tax=Trapa incisa TaxID=236973 RepID=A0AAN7GQC5_9MYRT|nr:hypothetical protein SAY87_012536 [Trapa incisa]
MVWSKNIHPPKSYVTDPTGTTDNGWFLGSVLLIIATLAWASLFVLQTKALETYKNHQLSLTSLVCLVGTLQVIAVTFAMEHKDGAWKMGWDMNLLAAAYARAITYATCRIVASSAPYYVQGLVIKKRGPVFASAFSPLMMIIVAITGSFILAEKIFLGGYVILIILVSGSFIPSISSTNYIDWYGRVIGAILIVMGLYSTLLWGKHKERQEEEEEEEEGQRKLLQLPEVVKVQQEDHSSAQETIKGISSHIGTVNKPSTVAISTPTLK